MRSTETRNLVALFLQLQRAVCVCVEPRDEGSGRGFGLGGGSAVLSLREHPAEAPGHLLHPSAFPCPLQPSERSCRGLPVPRLGFLGSNGTNEPPASLPPLSAPRAAALFVTQSRGRSPPGRVTARETLAAFQGARNGVGCLPVGTAPRQAQGANPEGAAQQFKCHHSGAAFFTTAGLTSCIYLV